MRFLSGLGFACACSLPSSALLRLPFSASTRRRGPLAAFPNGREHTREKLPRHGHRPPPSVLTSHFTRSTTRRLPALDPHIHLATLLAACLARRFQKREPRKLATRYPTSLVPRRGYRDTQGGGGAAKVVAFVLSLSLPLAGAPGPGDRACARPPAVKCQRVRPVDLHLQLRPPTTAAGVGVSSGVVRRKPPTGGLACLARPRVARQAKDEFVTGSGGVLLVCYFDSE